MEERWILEYTDVVCKAYPFDFGRDPEFTEWKVDALDKGPNEAYCKTNDGWAHEEWKPSLYRFLNKLGTKTAFNPARFFCLCHLCWENGDKGYFVKREYVTSLFFAWWTAGRGVGGTVPGYTMSPSAFFSTVSSWRMARRRSTTSVFCSTPSRLCFISSRAASMRNPRTLTRL